MKRGILFLIILMPLFFNCLKQRDNPLDPGANLPTKIKRISDYYFERKMHFILNRGYPIGPGSLKVYLDDNNKYNNLSTIPIVFRRGVVVETNDCDLLFNGTDYVVREDMGFVTFKRPIYSTDDVIITYTTNGVNVPFIASTNDYNDMDRDYLVTMTNNTKVYIFLFRRQTVSPYQHCGIYNLGDMNMKNGYFNLVIIDRYSGKLNNQPFTKRSTLGYSHSGPSYASYYIDKVNGLLIFDVPRPFNFPGSFYLANPSYSIYALYPLYYSRYLIHLEYR